MKRIFTSLVVLLFFGISMYAQKEALVMGFNMDSSRIPDNAILYNKAPTLWDVYRDNIIAGVVVFFVMVLILVVILLYKNSRTHKEMEMKAKRDSAMKSMFVQNMSHDVRTPLNAIIGFSQLLGLPDGMVSDEEKNEYKEIIENNANMLLMLVDDILNISDIESGTYKINKTNAILNDIIKSSVKCTESRCAAGVKMYWTSEVEDTYSINTDPRRVQQVLVNYLTNACKHTASGEIHVHCSLSENPGKATLSVADTGSGIDPAQAEIIFERFTMLNYNVQGTGIGLNICKTLAERLGGEVKLDTSYSGGARFLLILPL